MKALVVYVVLTAMACSAGLDLVQPPKAGPEVQASPKVERIVLADRVEYRVDGKLHRANGPAVIYRDGTREWYWNGLKHRDRWPAVTGPSGESWYVHGVQQKTEDPAVQVASVSHRDTPSTPSLDGDAVLHLLCLFGFLAVWLVVLGQSMRVKRRWSAWPLVKGIGSVILLLFFLTAMGPAFALIFGSLLVGVAFGKK